VHLVQYGDGGKAQDLQATKLVASIDRCRADGFCLASAGLEWRIPKRTAPGWGEPGARLSEAFGEIWRRRGNGAVFRENCRSLRF
jgi:hypothetical protein